MSVIYSATVSAIVLFLLIRLGHPFGGDISMTGSGTTLSSIGRRSKRAATAVPGRLWPNGIVPYEITPEFGGELRAKIQMAMLHWENYTCVQFVERNASDSEHQDFVFFTEMECGCCSHVGRRGDGQQNVSIGKGCYKLGIMVHELGHALGFWHEHTRPDRDKYVRIIEQNIMPGQEKNFNKMPASEVSSMAEKYDYESIMHYARDTYASGGDTIEPLNPTKTIGQRQRVSGSDIRQTNKLYKCAQCGRTFHGPSAAFRVDPADRMPRTCEWRIRRSLGERIILNITELHLFESLDCRTDYVQVHDGHHQGSPVIGRYCGVNRTTTTITSTGNRMFIRYSASTVQSLGFAANYASICGGNVTLSSMLRIVSPGYPLHYTPNSECVWSVTVPVNHQIALRFETFDLDPQSSDYVLVQHADHKRVAPDTFSGKQPPKKRAMLKSLANHMLIEFVSDGVRSASGFAATLLLLIDECASTEHGCQHKCVDTVEGYRCECRLGFELRKDGKSCKSGCGGTISLLAGERADIQSPSYPNPYPPDKKCTWRIRAPIGNVLATNFTSFSVEGSDFGQDSCEFDSVKLASIEQDNEATKQLKVRQQVFCGGRLPPAITSTTNVVELAFKSDGTVQGEGFRATLSVVADKCAIDKGGCQYKCENHLNSARCVCPAGFMVGGNQRDCVPGSCQHIILEPEGIVTSTNYPAKYAKNTDCLWVFRGTGGHRVALQFEDLDIESSQECYNDLLRIFFQHDNITMFYNKAVLRSRTMTLARVCGNQLPDVIRAPADHLYMTFKTDDSIQRRGFKIRHSTYCGGHFTAEFKTKNIYSHAKYGGENYPNNMDCDWILQSRLDDNHSRVHVVLSIANVETEQACQYDFIDVYDGDKALDATMYGRFCGNQRTIEFVSMRPAILIRFRTDSSDRRKGFTIAYEIANEATRKRFDGDSQEFVGLEGPPIISNGLSTNGDIIEE